MRSTPLSDPIRTITDDYISSSGHSPAPGSHYDFFSICGPHIRPTRVSQLLLRHKSMLVIGAGVVLISIITTRYSSDKDAPHTARPSPHAVHKQFCRNAFLWRIIVEFRTDPASSFSITCVGTYTGESIQHVWLNTDGVYSLLFVNFCIKAFNECSRHGRLLCLRFFTSV